MISFENVSKNYGDVQVLQNISLEIRKGEFICAVGTSGSGKTTFIRMINRMDEPTQGVIKIDGVDIRKNDEIQLRRKIGYVIQNIGLFPHMTIRDNIMIVPKLLKWTKNQKEEIAESLIKKVDLPVECLNRYPANLSGGQQQRVGVIRALAANQSIILMDEPFGAVDPITRKSLQDLIKNIQRELDKTIVFVTHDMDEAMKLADRIIVMDKGRIVQFDTPINILSNPVNDFVKALIGNHKINGSHCDGKKVGEIMELNPLFVTLSESTEEAFRVMIARERNRLFVVNNQDILEGEIDFKNISDNHSEDIPVKEVMKESTAFNENELVKDVVFSVLHQKIDYFPIVNSSHKLTGIITKDVLLKFLHEQLK